MRTQRDVITTRLGDFSKERFNALVNIRATALDELRETLADRGYTEVTTSTLVNIAGSCENPHESFTLNYYGREAHLSQSAQIQLENLVLGLRRAVFTINNSFREETYEDPQAKGRKLAEFTLIEPERPYQRLTPKQALDRIITEEAEVIKHATQRVLERHSKDIKLLGGNNKYLKKVVLASFPIITYDEAIDLLNRNKQKERKYKFGDDLGMLEERTILEYFGNTPTFVTHYPASIKFFNMKRMPDGQRVYSVDLLMPKLGETTGGAVREENVEKIKQQLRESRVADYLRNRARGEAIRQKQDPELAAKTTDPVKHFPDYFNILSQVEPVLRGGYGIGFERFVGFLLQSNDILDTVAYRTLHP